MSGYVEQGDPCVAISRILKMSIAAAVLDVAGLAPCAQAQTASWDETLSNSFWYVSVPQLLAYGAVGGS
jgi:hypothetical protein